MTDAPPPPSPQASAVPDDPAANRRHQLFPTLTAAQVDRLRPFGERRSWPDGARLFETGQPGPGMFVVLRGRVRITRRDGLGHESLVVEQGPGEFLAEVGQLSGAPALVDGTALGEVEALLLPPDRLRALLVAEAELGEIIMRALILRRVSLIGGGGVGPVLLGPASDPTVARLSGFLSRNGQPHAALDPDEDADAAAFLARFGLSGADLPLVVLADGGVLRGPDETALAARLGMGAEGTPALVDGGTVDVAVVGAGPAGLATAVYAASEGLSVLVLDARAFGGQAGASARIENYLGFPTGISGQALAGRAYVQAAKFGAQVAVPAPVARLDCAADPLALHLAGGQVARARAVVVASGAAYRRPDIPGLAEHEAAGRGGVSYWASPVEARLCRGRDVVLVGGGNSAGQAAVYLSAHCRKVSVVVRGDGLAATMSRYLIERIAAQPNVEVLPRTEVAALRATGEGSHAALSGVVLRHRDTGAEEERAVAHLFLFVGADPNTGWLAGCGVATDRAGFVRTGDALGAGDLDARYGRRRPAALETSVPGVFAIGDARAGSVKRVASAVGEGAAVVALLHAHLAARSDDEREAVGRARAGAAAPRGSDPATASLAAATAAAD